MTANTIVPFLFDSQITVRVIDRDGDPWFVAADVCRALGLVNAAEAVRGLDEDEKDISTTDTLGGHQEVVVISESGLFAMIFKSRKPNAVAFRKWVTSEVLPSLRKAGAYLMPQGQPMPLRAWKDWTLEERRTALAKINTARRVYNQGAAAWMWCHLGLPVPPPHLLPGWWQGELLSRTPNPSTN